MGLNKEVFTIKNKKTKGALAAAIVSTLIVGSFFIRQAVLRSGYLQIKEVRFIETNSSNLSGLINQPKLLEKVAIKSDQTIFSTDLLGIEERLGSIPWIESLQIQRKIPNTIEVRYSTYEGAGYATINGKLWIVSTDGVALGEVPNPLRYDFPVFSISGSKKLEDFVGHVQWARRLAQFGVEEIRFKSENYYEILLNISGRKVVLKAPESTDENVNNEIVNRFDRVVQYINKHNIFVSEIDIRAGKKVVVNIGKSP